MKKSEFLHIFRKTEVLSRTNIALKEKRRQRLALRSQDIFDVLLISYNFLPYQRSGKVYFRSPSLHRGHPKDQE